MSRRGERRRGRRSGCQEGSGGGADGDLSRPDDSCRHHGPPIVDPAIADAAGRGPRHIIPQVK